MLEKFFEGKNILVTGGTGTVGREIVRQLLKFNSGAIRVFSRDESKQFEMQQELKFLASESNALEGVREGRVRYLIGDIRDEKRLCQALKNIDIVFHTAALKHVLVCEYNPFEALKTNDIGTQNLIDAAFSENVELVVYTSSDKAVNPYNTMGASKLLAEKLITAANYYKGNSRTRFSTVRFGNVLGSRGSLTYSLMEQIKRGGPVTLTDPQMTRFIMSIQQSVELIFEAAAIACGGEIFILKMPSAKILDLISVMVEEFAPVFGRNASDIKTEKIGILPGEKLYEELMTSEENKRALETENLFIILPEIKELIRNEMNYPGTARAQIATYTSSVQPALSRQQLRSMLSDAGVIKADIKDSIC